MLEQTRLTTDANAVLAWLDTHGGRRTGRGAQLQVDLETGELWFKWDAGGTDHGQVHGRLEADRRLALTDAALCKMGMAHRLRLDEMVDRLFELYATY